MHSFKTLSILLALALSLGMTGCQTNGDDVPVVEATSPSGAPMLPPEQGAMEPAEGPGLGAATSTRFADIPLPLGVKEDMDRTYVFESQGFRVGRMVYNSRDNVPEVAQFYIRECPVNGWALTSTVQAEGVNLQFTKGTERLDVSVYSPGVGRANVLILNLTPTQMGGAAAF